LLIYIRENNSKNVEIKKSNRDKKENKSKESNIKKDNKREKNNSNSAKFVTKLARKGLRNNVKNTSTEIQIMK
jgi:hypothetical protein